MRTDSSRLYRNKYSHGLDRTTIFVFRIHPILIILYFAVLRKYSDEFEALHLD